MSTSSTPTAEEKLQDLIERTRELPKDIREWEKNVNVSRLCLADFNLICGIRDRMKTLEHNCKMMKEALEKHEPGGCTCVEGCEKCWIHTVLSQISQSTPL